MKKFYGIFIMLLMVQLSFAQKVSVPQLNAPENEFETAMPDVILDWSAVSGVGQISYHLQLATDDAFSDLVVDTDGIEISAYYNMNLLFGQQYYWRVSAMDESDDPNSDWSEVFTFTVFSQVVLDKPKDEDDEVDILAEFKWKAKVDGEDILGVDGFHIDLDTTDTFDSPYYQMYTAEGIVFSDIPNYLLFGEVHYWRVRPMHAASNGEWSETRSFETVLGVELDKPSNNASDQEFDLALSWDALGEYDPEEDDNDLFEYTVEVSIDEDFTEPATFIVLGEEITPNFLKFGVDYWWRVKATHPNDVSPWSEVNKFSMIASVVLDAPTDGQDVLTLRPRLEWETIEGVDGYTVYISENADLSDATIYNIEENIGSYPLPELEREMDYYWSVVAKRETDMSEMAETFHFRVINVGVDELSKISEISIFPNPASTNLALSFIAKESGDLKVSIADVLGKTISNEVIDVKTGIFNQNIDISELNNGIYFLELTQGQETKVIKFLVK